MAAQQSLVVFDLDVRAARLESWALNPPSTFARSSKTSQNSSLSLCLVAFLRVSPFHSAFLHFF